MKRGLMLTIIAAALVVAAAILGIYAYASKENSSLDNIDTELKTARIFYERETERASMYSKQTAERIETEDLRYTELKRRVDELEKKTIAQAIRIVNESILVDTVKPKPKAKVMKSRVRQ